MTAACDDRGSLGTGPIDVSASPTHQLALGVFDPNHVYLWGTTEPGLCNSVTPGIAWIGDGKSTVGGMPCWAKTAQIRPRDGKLVYSNSSYGGVFSTTPIPLVFDPSVADERVSVSCPGEDSFVVRFLYAPDGSLFYACGVRWFNEAGIVVHETGVDSAPGRYHPPRLGSSTLAHIGCRGYALVGNGVLDLNHGTVAHFPAEYQPAIEDGVDILAVRAAADGFWLIIAPDPMSRRALYHTTFDGSLSYLGEYASAGSANNWILTPDGSLYSASSGSVTRRRPDGQTVMTVYRESNNSLQIHGTSQVVLFSGP